MDRIAIISTRLGGIDGVSIEADKWARAYSRIGLDPYYIAGHFDRENKGRFFLIEEMDYYHPEIMRIRKAAFNEDGSDGRHNAAGLISDIGRLKDIIKSRLIDILRSGDFKYFSIENALTIPLNIPIGPALTEVISEKRIKTISRHHDFYWEREQFTDNNVEDILNSYFPPNLESLVHVVINTRAKKSLKLKKDIDACYIPNVFDFDILKTPGNNYIGVKKYLGMQEDDILVLQPTRFIQRKNIERTIDLVHSLDKRMVKRVCLVISGKPEKNELDYFYMIVDLARKKEIDLVINQNEYEGNYSFVNAGLFEKYGIYDLYRACDLVTLPSDIEGFGNPVLEASIFRKPLFVNNYPVLSDFLRKGFEFILINKVVDRDSVEKTIEVLSDEILRKKMTGSNFNIARDNYSMEYLVGRLGELIRSL